MIRFRPTLDYTHINRVLSNHPFIVYFLTVSKQAENVRVSTVDNRHHCSRLIFHLDNISRMEIMFVFTVKQKNVCRQLQEKTFKWLAKFYH